MSLFYVNIHAIWQLNCFFSCVGGDFSGGEDSSIERVECWATEGIWGTAAGTAEDVQRGDRGFAGTDIWPNKHSHNALLSNFCKNCTAW